MSALLGLGGLHGADAGVNEWTINGPEAGEAWGILALAVDPQSPTIVYTGTSSAGIFKSTDAGATSSAVNAGLTNPYIDALAVDPQAPARLRITVSLPPAGTSRRERVRDGTF